MIHPADDPRPEGDPIPDVRRVLDEDVTVSELEERLLAPLRQVVKGQATVIRQMAITLLAGGHALLEGVPGTGKTLAVRALSRSLGLRFGRVQFTPDLMPTDLVGVSVLDPATRSFEYRAGPVFTDLLLADEVNRAPAKTQAALLEAMEERQVTVDGTTRSLPVAFTVFATQNPVEYEGTYPLPEAQLDRFLMKIVVDYPSEEAERAVLDGYAGGFRSGDEGTFGITAPLSHEELASHRAAVGRVHVDERIRHYITSLVRATRGDRAFALGASPRAGVALFQATRAEAHLSGRDFATPDDVKRLAFPVLRHRVLLTPDAEVEGRTSDDELSALLETLEAPR
ncbi:MAG: MoxR family ATPase [Gemmatimonadota bacterium]|nr:MoxR family ATPase [Gemmatimonadota bacterium]MDH5760672.1 MoxR family ATPase [Gemmatimonadota bacterium]